MEKEDVITVKIYATYDTLGIKTFYCLDHEDELYEIISSEEEPYVFSEDEKKCWHASFNFSETVIHHFLVSMGYEYELKRLYEFLFAQGYIAWNMKIIEERELKQYLTHKTTDFLSQQDRLQNLYDNAVDSFEEQEVGKFLGLLCQTGYEIGKSKLLPEVVYMNHN